MTHAADLTLLLDAAREAGEIARGFHRGEPQVWWKEGNSPVSEADFAVDAYLKTTLLGARPGYGWLSEESAAEPASAPGPARFFVIDPIDGTRSFLRGEETWCVSIALVEGARPVAGVVVVPMRGEAYRASAGEGSFLNEARLAFDPAASDEPLRIALPDPFRRKLGAAQLAALRLVPNIPSLAYRIVQVADGRIDGTLVRPNANDWDIAAADLILAEAGGRLGDADGQKRLYKTEARRHGLLIAATASAWPRMQELAQAATKA